MPTCETTHFIRSGCCVSVAPISSPPLLPPMIASFAGDVYFRSIRCFSTAAKSSNTFCLFVRLPGRCHSSPNSPPPRRLATATTNPWSSSTRVRRVERRRDADAVAAVAGHQARVRAVELRPLRDEDVHRHLRAVLGRGELADDLDVVEIDDRRRRRAAASRSRRARRPGTGSGRTARRTSRAANRTSSPRQRRQPADRRDSGCFGAGGRLAVEGRRRGSPTARRAGTTTYSRVSRRQDGLLARRAEKSVTIASFPSGTTTVARVRSSVVGRQAQDLAPRGVLARDEVQARRPGRTPPARCLSSKSANCATCRRGPRRKCANSPPSPFCTVASTRPVGGCVSSWISAIRGKSLPSS